jgi:hypothetical protein
LPVAGLHYSIAGPSVSRASMGTPINACKRWNIVLLRGQCCPDFVQHARARRARRYAGTLSSKTCSSEQGRDLRVVPSNQRAESAATHRTHLRLSALSTIGRDDSANALIP